jgi:uncharacterized spore protein YtfJ
MHHPQWMNLPELLKSISDRVATAATVRNVYGDPVSVGARTVIPIAKVSFGFGGGGGSAKKGAGEPEGGGGGGGMRAVPYGALEIGPEGTRFIGLFNGKRLAGAFAAGIVIGMLASRNRQMALIRSRT